MSMPFWLNKLAARAGVGRLLTAAGKKDDGTAAFRHYLSDRCLSIPPSDLTSALPHADVLEPDAIDLAHATPRIDGPRLPAGRVPVPPPAGLPELRLALSEYLAAQHRLSIDADGELLITHGASGALASALDALLNPGQRVVLFDPTSPLYPMMLRHRRARVLWVPTWAEQGRVRFHLEPLTKALAGARLLILADPVNPTGAVFGPEDLEQIAWWANRQDVLLIQDQTFVRFDESERPPLASFPNAASRTLSIGSFSAGHGLAAARVGWIAGHRHLVAPCQMAQTLTAPLVPTLCQQLALAALQAGEETTRLLRQHLSGRRQFVHERLQAMGLAAPWPAAGYFLWMPVYSLNMSGTTFAERIGRDKKVLMRPGDAFGPSGTGFVRLSIGGDEGRLLEGLTRLAEMLNEIKKAAVPKQIESTEEAA